MKKIVGLWLLLGFFSAGNALAATFDITGNWDVTNSNHFNNCGDPNPPPFQETDLVVQTGDTFTTVTPMFTVSGTVTGADYDGRRTFFEDGGTVVSDFNATASSNAQMDGSVSWTWSDGVFTCSGGWTVSMTRQAQSPAVYDAAGIWDYSESNHVNTCNEPNPQPSSDVRVIDQSGNKVTVVDDLQQIYAGFLSGPDYTFLRSYPEDGGTTSEEYDVTLDAGGTTGTGTVNWIWNDAVEFCNGAFSFSLQKRAPLAMGDLDNTDRDDLVADFGGSGLWAYMNDTNWPMLTSGSPQYVATGDVNGDSRDDVIADLAPNGIWVSRSLGAWAKLHSAASELLAAGDLDNDGRDDAIIDFGTSGLWAYMNDSNWLSLTSGSPDAVVVGDVDGTGPDDVIGDFGTNGIWMRLNLGAWEKLHASDPESMAIGDLDDNGRDDVLIDFGGSGLWAYMNDATWLKVLSSSPDLIATGDIDGNGADDILASFALSGAGLWQRLNLGSWSILNTNAPNQVVTGDVDNSGKDDIIATFTSAVGAIYIKRNQDPWVQLN